MALSWREMIPFLHSLALIHLIQTARFRYSPEFKYRPAASPVVREKLKGGRTRVRGGRPGDDIDPPAPMKRVAPPVTTKKRKKRRAGGTF